MSTPQEPIANRVIVHGASNVTIGLPTVVRLIHSGFNGPLQIDIADGHGRSYGMPTSVLFRGLPGHTMRPIPPAAPANKTSAILTDIGNDLVYSIPVRQVAKWVWARAEQLAELSAEIVMTELPLESIATLSKSRFRFFRAIFFPGSTVGFSELRESAQQLNESVREIASVFNAKLIVPPAAWYGFDPIHIRRLARRDAWTHTMEAWEAWSKPKSLKPSAVGSVRIWGSKSQYGSWRGKDRTHSNTLALDSKTTLRFF
jgi:hypothetical protein